MKHLIKNRFMPFYALLAATPFLFFSPTIALSETKSAPVKQWADPGAAEKAKTDSAAQEQNKPAIPPAVPAKSTATDTKAPSAAAPNPPALDKKVTKHSEHEKPAKAAEHEHPKANKSVSSKPVKAAKDHNKARAVAHAETKTEIHAKDKARHHSTIVRGKPSHTGHTTSVAMPSETNLDLPDTIPGL